MTIHYYQKNVCGTMRDVIADQDKRDAFHKLTRCNTVSQEAKHYLTKLTGCDWKLVEEKKG